MSQHELILLSPYRFPGANALTLSQEDMACWLNGHSVLWHPAAVWAAKEPPRVDASYDHETPRSNCIYAVPDTPPTYLPDDWRDRVRQAGSIAVTAMPDRAATFANLREGLAAEGAPGLGCKECLDLPNDKIGPFFGIGYGHLLQATLAEAMEHENLLETASFWDEVQHAIALVAGLPFTPSAPAAPLGRESAPFDEAGAIAAAAADDSDSDTNPNIETPTDPHIVGELSERRYDYSAHESAASTTKVAPTREADPNARIEHLQNAASKRQSPHEVLYPAPTQLLDFCVPDETASA